MGDQHEPPPAEENQNEALASWSEMISDVPIAVAPTVPMEVPNQPLPLYTGPLLIHSEDPDWEMEAEIALDWLPDARVRITGRPPREILHLPRGRAEITIPGLIRAARVLWTEFTPGGHLSGILNQKTTLGDSTQLAESVEFSLVNLRPNVGGQVRSEDPADGIWTGRWVIRLEEWEITLDSVRGWKALEKGLRSIGGFAVSHGGRIERIDGGTIGSQCAEGLMNALHFFFGFLAGGWIGPVRAVGVREGKEVWETAGPWLLSPWKDRRSWFPRRSYPDLNLPLQRFLALWSDPDWKTPLTHFIWWYIEAATSTSESALVMTQTALELMGWVQLVEEAGTLSPDGFKNLPAADKIRILLRVSGIPPEIPGHLTDLDTYAKANNIPDGPGVISEIRNAVVHPSRKKRAKMAGVPGHGKLEAAELGRLYLELVLLALIGYQGEHLDRSKGGFVETATALVPWAEK